MFYKIKKVVETDPMVVLKMIAQRRIARILMYVGLSLSGFFATIFPSRLVVDQVGGELVIVWGISMFVSSLICLWGTLTDKWLGEFAGLPLLSSVLFLYGFSALLSFISISINDSSLMREQGPLFAYGFVVVSSGFGLIARWQDVASIKNASHEVNDSGHRGRSD